MNVPRFGLAMALLAGSVAFAQVPTMADPWPQARGLVSQALQDLQSGRANGPKDDRKRYNKAEKRLSNFDRHLVKRHFDKGQLDGAIGDIKDVLDHNTLSPDLRNALMKDIGDLRKLRSDYDSWKR